MNNVGNKNLNNFIDYKEENYNLYVQCIPYKRPNPIHESEI